MFLCEASLLRECLTLRNSALSCSAQSVLRGKTACVQQHDEITAAWLLKLYCGVPSEAACAQGGQLSSLLPQTGILSTWQTSKSGVTLKPHAVMKKKYLCHNCSALFPFTFFRKGRGRLQLRVTEGGAKLSCRDCYTDLRADQIWYALKLERREEKWKCE